MNSRVIAGMGVAALLWMAAVYSPSGAGWTAFATDPLPFGKKAGFFADMYLFPGALAFVAVVAFQAVQRISMGGAKIGTLFGTAVWAWTLMLFAISGMGSISRPAVIGGMALGLAISAQVYAVSLPMCRFGFSYPRVIFRWNKRAVEEFNSQIVRPPVQRRPEETPPRRGEQPSRLALGD
jgi:hypothetical protein